MSTRGTIYYGEYKDFKYHFFEEVHEDLSYDSKWSNNNGKRVGLFFEVVSKSVLKHRTCLDTFSIFLPNDYAECLMDFFKNGKSEFVKDDGELIWITPYNNNACIHFTYPRGSLSLESKLSLWLKNIFKFK